MSFYPMALRMDCGVPPGCKNCSAFYEYSFYGVAGDKAAADIIVQSCDAWERLIIQHLGTEASVDAHALKKTYFNSQSRISLVKSAKGGVRFRRVEEFWCLDMFIRVHQFLNFAEVDELGENLWSTLRFENPIFMTGGVEPSTLSAEDVRLVAGRQKHDDEIQRWGYRTIRH